jgi:hypothetical protein
MDQEPTTDDGRRSRRAVLGAAAAGAVALTAGRLIGAEPAAAVAPNFLLGTSNDGGGAETQLDSNFAGTALYVNNYDGTAVIGAGNGPDGNAGVIGSTNSVVGVWGIAAVDGVGVLGTSVSGYGLKVQGKAGFSTAGHAWIAKGTSSIKVDLHGVTTSSLVIATLQTYRTGFHVEAVVTYGGKFRIYVNKKAPVKTKVAFFVID